MEHWWTRQSETVRWLLWLPAIALITAIVGIPVFLIAYLSNRAIWGPLLGSVISGLYFGFVPLRLALVLAPRWKLAAAGVATLPLTILAVGTVVNGLVDVFGARHLTGGVPGPAHEGLWGVAWLVAAGLAIRDHRIRSKRGISSTSEQGKR